MVYIPFNYADEIQAIKNEIIEEVTSMQNSIYRQTKQIEKSQAMISEYRLKIDELEDKLKDKK